MIDKNATLQQLYSMAVQSLAEVQPGETFLVKDLFRGFEWARIPVSTRIQLGSLFLANSKAFGGNDVVPAYKTKQKQQVYKKL